MAIALSRGQISDTAAAIFTATADTKIKSILIHNTLATAEGVQLFAVPSGGSADLTTRFLSYNLAGEDTFEFSLNFPLSLATGDTIYASTTTADSVNYWVNGV